MDSPLCFDGNLARTPVPIVLHRIVQRRARGTLTLSRTSERIHLFFVNGELKAANSTRAGMRLGDALLVHGILPEEEFEVAVQSIKGGRGGRIGKALVEKGLVPREILDAQTRHHFEEIFFSCFSWREGEFAFLPSSGELDSDVSLDLPTAALIVEGVRREAGGEIDPAMLGDPAFYGHATPLTNELQALRLSSEEAYFLALCDGKTRLRDMLRLGPSRAEGLQTLSTLLACGLIEFTPWPFTSPARLAADVPFLPGEESPDGEPADDAEARDDRARESYATALTLLSDDNYADAIVLLQECVRLFPYDVDYRFQLGAALARNPLWRRRALVQYREALGFDPYREDLLLAFAELLLSEKKFAAAAEIARRLVARYPEVARHHEIFEQCRAAARREPPGDPGVEHPGRGLSEL